MNLFQNVLKGEEELLVCGKSFKFLNVINKSNDTLVCNCIGIHDDLEYIIKIIKLDNDDCLNQDYKLGEWKYAQDINRLLNSNILPIHMMEQIGDEIIIVSSKFGMDLYHLYNAPYQNDKLLLCEALQILISITNALQSIHQANIIHRDIKPSNILINYNSNHLIPNVVLGNFGFCRKLNKEKLEIIDKEYEIIFGTRGFIAPECYIDGIYTMKSDMWSLGRTMLWLLFIRNQHYDSLDEMDEYIQGIDLNSHHDIELLVKFGKLNNDDDVNGWRVLFSIIRDLLVKSMEERLTSCQILDRLSDVKLQQGDVFKDREIEIEFGKMSISSVGVDYGLTSYNIEKVLYNFYQTLEVVESFHSNNTVLKYLNPNNLKCHSDELKVLVDYSLNYEYLPSCDIYSLGYLLFNLLTNTTLKLDKVYKNRDKFIENLIYCKLPQLPYEVNNILSKCITFNKNDS